ncbi:MGDG synthase family glycosyltransferase [Alteribacter aurantiacus]|uniref:MGDG synthase family glycosyltransferase n=1 Tax=Alteribacter aurantiacus TaxID=254410 RepID=UPI000478E3FB|nr:glycosyltransferase [Alteribacter aurantiacus]
MRVILLTVSAGAGHDAVCDVVKQEWEKRGAHCEVIDLFNCLPSLFKKTIPALYLSMVQVVPPLWRFIYKKTNTPYSNPFLFRRALWQGANHRMKISAPSIIIATHPLATAVAAKAIRDKTFKQTPALYSLVTDYSFHGMSLTKEVTAVFLPDKNETHSLQRTYPFAQFIHGCISVHKKWFEKIDQLDLRQRLGLPIQGKIAAISGGKEGLLRYKEVIKSFEKEGKGVWTLLCFTGENHRAAKQLSTLKTKHDVRTFPYTPVFSDYVKASDVLISKPGGVTMTEALAANVPTIMTSPLPGQEEENEQRLKEHFVQSSIKQVGKKAELLVNNPKKMLSPSQVSTAELVDKMLLLYDGFEAKKQAYVGNGSLYRMNHILTMKQKQKEKGEFHT